MLTSTFLSHQGWLWIPEPLVSIPQNTGIASVGYHACLKMTFQGDRFPDRGAMCWQCLWKVLFSDIDIRSQPRPEYKPASEANLVSIHVFTWHEHFPVPVLPSPTHPRSQSLAYQVNCTSGLYFQTSGLVACALKKISLFWNYIYYYFGALESFVL